jgi:CNT family concentrative nucleoside transporter
VSWLNLVSLVGCVALCALAWLLGGCRRPFPSRTVVGAGSLLLALGMAVFWLPPMRVVLLLLNRLVLALLDAAGAGALYLFGPLALAPGRSTPGGEPSVGFVLATQVLPAVVFFASLMAALYHVGALQPVVRVLGRLFHRTLGLSGAEALAGSANVFFGVESAAAVRPYLERMTRSELLTLLTCGMSTVASTTLAIYVLFLRDPFPGIAGHLISASLLSVPAAALMAKLILPETGDPETRGDVPAVAPGERHGNVMAALAAGAMEGLKLAAGIATLLIAVLGLVAVVDLALARGSGALLGAEPPLDLSRLLGWLFTPLAWLLGIDPAEVPAAASLLGERIIRTEVVAYQDLAGLASDATISTRTMVILSYALCGFAHVASMGIFVGGFAALAPARRDDLAALGPRALLGATLATLLTGALAGLFFAGQSGLLGG